MRDALVSSMPDMAAALAVFTKRIPQGHHWCASVIFPCAAPGFKTRIKKRRTPFGEVFEAFVLQTPRQCWSLVFDFHRVGKSAGCPPSMFATANRVGTLRVAHPTTTRCRHGKGHDPLT